MYMGEVCIKCYDRNIKDYVPRPLLGTAHNVLRDLLLMRKYYDDTTVYEKYLYLIQDMVHDMIEEQNQTTRSAMNQTNHDDLIEFKKDRYQTDDLYKLYAQKEYIHPKQLLKWKNLQIENGHESRFKEFKQFEEMDNDFGIGRDYFKRLLNVK